MRFHATFLVGVEQGRGEGPEDVDGLDGEGAEIEAEEGGPDG